MDKIVLHHIGGRNGSRQFPILQKFESDFVSVLYDADESCLKEIQEKNRDLKSQLFVLPYCIGKICGPVNFNLNYDPFTSSLLKKNPDYDLYCHDSYDQFQGKIDYVFGETLSVVKEIPMQAVSLDYLFFEKKIDAPAPDFLSIDTQGNELDILLGANKTLDHVLGIITEIEFVPLYKNQPLFGDILQHLQANDFDFIDFTYLGKLRPAITPIGLRGPGLISFGDALFLKKPKSLLNIKNQSLRILSLKKLAFMYIVYSQIELALECLNILKADKATLYSEGDPQYCLFLHLFQLELAKYSKYPFRFKIREQQTNISSHNNLNEHKIGFKKKSINYLKLNIKKILKKSPYAFDMAVKLYLMKYWDWKKILNYLNPNRFSYFGVEKVLYDFGLAYVAKELRKRRLDY